MKLRDGNTRMLCGATGGSLTAICAMASKATASTHAITPSACRRVFRRGTNIFHLVIDSGRTGAHLCLAASYGHTSAHINQLSSCELGIRALDVFRMETLRS